MFIDLYVKCPLIVSHFNKHEFSLQILEKRSNIQFNENPSIGSRVVLCGQTDRRTDLHDETNSRFSKFCERA
jgi:hypothetical protein